MNFVAVKLSKKTLTKRIIFGVFCLFFIVGLSRIALAEVDEKQLLSRTDVASVRSVVARNSHFGAKYRFTDSKFIKAAQDKNSVQTEVGESGSAEFKPNLTVSKWNGEASFKVRPDIFNVPNGEKNLAIDGEQIDYRAGKKDYVYYDDPGASENGGYEFKIILNEKPETNIFSEAIESSGVEFYLQVPLDEEAHRPGLACTETECKDFTGRVVISRPEDVVDSIAVYATGKSGDYTATGGMNYMAGKVAQIKRVKAIDVDGNSVYCKQTIADGIWTKTCPQDFLDKAAYPVVIDPTLGYTNIGASNDSGDNDTFLMSTYNDWTYGLAGTSNTMKIAAWHSSGTGHLKMALYAGRMGAPLVVNSSTGELLVSQTTKPTQDSQWISGNDSASLSANTQYGMAFNTDNNNVNVAYDSDSSVYSWYVYSSGSYLVFPPATSPSSLVPSSVIYSIYATYSPGPVITIANPDTAPAQSKTISASASDGTLTMKVDAGSTCDATVTGFIDYAAHTFTAESDNGKTICYKAVDAGGASYLLSNAIAGIDTTVPGVTGLSNDTNPLKSKTWSWGASETSTYRYLIDQSSGGVPSGMYGSTVAVTQSLGDGTYYIHVQAKDAAGNESSVATVSAILDNAAPVITITNPTTAPAQSKIITASSTDGIFSMADTTGSACDGTLSFIAYASQTFTSESDNGAKVCYRAIDIAGNISYSLSGAISGIDATGPTIAGLTTDTAPVKIKTWNWSSEPGATFRFVIDTNASSTVSGVYASATTTAQSSGNGTYYIHVQAKDAAGNESSVVTVFTILDNTPPVITVSGTNPVSVTLGSTYADGGAAATDNIDVSVNVVLSGSVDTATDGDYMITYNAVDAAGNAAAPATRTVHVVAPDLPITKRAVHPVSGQFVSVAKVNFFAANSNDQAWRVGQIQYLQSEIVRLQKLLAKTGSNEIISSAKYSCSSIAKNLSYGMANDPQVHCLQEFLGGQGVDIYPEKMVTGNFFDVTKAAVIRFQEKYAEEILVPSGLTRANGVVGPNTRKIINGMIFSDQK
jgi:hypothetical protein